MQKTVLLSVMPHLAQMMKHVWKHELNSILKCVFSKCVSFPVCLLKDYSFMGFWLWCRSVYVRWIVKVVVYCWSHCYIYEGIVIYIIVPTANSLLYLQYLRLNFENGTTANCMFVRVFVCLCVCVCVHTRVWESNREKPGLLYTILFQLNFSSVKIFFFYDTNITMINIIVCRNLCREFSKNVWDLDTI